MISGSVVGGDQDELLGPGRIGDDCDNFVEGGGRKRQRQLSSWDRGVKQDSCVARNLGVAWNRRIDEDVVSWQLRGGEGFLK